MSWSLGDDDDDCSGDGYSNDQTAYKQCYLTPGIYELKCMDSAGDGWGEGASISVFAYDSDKTTLVDEVYCENWDCYGCEEKVSQLAIGGKNCIRDIFRQHFI